MELHDPLLPETILRLKHLGAIDIPESDYGFAEIFKIHDDVFVYLIPMYGGPPTFHSRTNSDIESINNLIIELQKLT